MKLNEFQRKAFAAHLAREERRALPLTLVCVDCGMGHLRSPGGGICRSCNSPRLLDLSSDAGRAALSPQPSKGGA